MRVLFLAERPSSASGGPYRLGRHVEHHPESRGFATTAPHSAIRTVKHVRHCPPYQQGDVGSPSSPCRPRDGDVVVPRK